MVVTNIESAKQSLLNEQMLLSEYLEKNKARIKQLRAELENENQREVNLRQQLEIINEALKVLQ